MTTPYFSRFLRLNCKKKIEKPLITVITVVYNGVEYLEGTIVSVLEQTYKNVEYIVVDGGSTDGTLQIINKYQGDFDFWVSEPDEGIYDAMNKGAGAASGDWVYFLNSGDKFYDNSFLDELFELNIDSTVDLIIGDVIYDSGEFVSGRYSKLLYIHNVIHHQGVVYRRSALGDKPYDTEYKILADYFLNKLLYSKGSKAIFFHRVFAVCSDGGVSRSSLFVVLKENLLIIVRTSVFPYFIFFCFIFLVKFFSIFFISKCKRTFSYLLDLI